MSGRDRRETWVGRSIRRVEDFSLVTGRGRFTADLTAAQWVRFVRSPVAAGRIESITGGISAANAASSTQGLPNVDPIFTWVRLAQRIPVRIGIEQVPPEVSLVAGMTCSVSVVGGTRMPVAGRDRGLFYRLENLL